MQPDAASGRRSRPKPGMVLLEPLSLALSVQSYVPLIAVALAYIVLVLSE